MGIFRKVLGPASKYDKTLPYTYQARVDALRGLGREPVYQYYYADTICGLLDYLRQEGISPDEADLFEVYQGDQREIKKEYCLDANRRWLSRPEICNALREHYKGHIDEFSCSFRDRDRQGCGPY